ncbi:hypothetical protein [Rhodothermus marinus]|uniref:DprA-like winged helix domain-containing protein n=1 Tax=Rhodothermus marinus TaxID=29549 RepID=UPI0034E2383D
MERQLYDALEPEPIHIDTICERTGLDLRRRWSIFYNSNSKVWCASWPANSFIGCNKPWAMGWYLD